MIEIEFGNVDLIPEGESLTSKGAVKMARLKGGVFLTLQHTREEVFFEGDLGSVKINLRDMEDASGLLRDIAAGEEKIVDLSFKAPRRGTFVDIGGLDKFTLTSADIHTGIKGKKITKLVPFEQDYQAIALQLLRTKGYGSGRSGWAEFAMKGAVSLTISEDLLVALADLADFPLYDPKKQRSFKFEGRSLNEISVAANPALRTRAPGLDDLGHGKGEYGKPEHYMARKNLRILQDYAAELLEMLESGMALPEWIESQITVASTYVRDAKHYLEHGEPLAESKNKGARRLHTQRRNGR